MFQKQEGGEHGAVQPKMRSERARGQARGLGHPWTLCSSVFSRNQAHVERDLKRSIASRDFTCGSCGNGLHNGEKDQGGQSVRR